MKFLRFIRFRNPEIFILGILALLYYFFVLNKFQTVLNYKMQFFLYDYHFGFIRRGLIGEVLNFFRVKISENFIYVFSSCLLITLGVLTLKIIDSITFKNKIYNYILVGFLFIHPGLFKNLWHDIGRTDIFLVLYCAIILLVAFYKFSKLKDFFLFSSPILLLIHEAALILWLPAIYVCWLLPSKKIMKEKNKQLLIKTIIFFFLVGIVFILIQLYGNFNGDPQIFKDYIQSKIGTEYKMGLLIPGYGDSTKHMYDSFINNFSHKRVWIYGFSSILIVLYVGYAFLRDSGINWKKYILVIIFPLFISFGMFFLGFDLLRWFSNITLLVFYIILSILMVNNEKLETDRTEVKIDTVSLMLIILIMLNSFNYLGITYS